MTRVLLAVTVYNGRGYVPRCLESAMRIDRSAAEIDVLALDDASPEPGFSEELERVCRDLGVGYYRTPRNLGIVRNVNLGLLRAASAGYDYVIISNSDVIYPSNLVTALLAAAESDKTIGSVTAWSNNVSIYSLPNADPDAYLADQDVVNWVSESLAGEFGPAAVDIPAGISFCVMISAAALADVGLMDPVFGRGYCEETDWCLRSVAAGYRLTLAPSAFVYHQGRASTLEAGLVAGGHSTVPENEAIIDLRYPLFRSQVAAFEASDIRDTLWRNASRKIMRAAASEWGYTIELTWLPQGARGDDIVRVYVSPDGHPPLLEAAFKGFRASIPLEGRSAGAAIREFFGTDPQSIESRSTGSVARSVLAEFGASDTDVRQTLSYPERV